MSGNPAQTYQDELVPMLFAPWAGELIDRAGVNASDHVLDVACGTGVIARELAKRLGTEGQVVGVDVAPPMIELAQSIPIPGGKAIDWRVADSADLPFDDGSFEVAVCQQGFQFFPDKVASALEIRRVLKPGGRLAFSVWAGLDRHPIMDAFNESGIRNLGDPTTELPYSYNDVGLIEQDLGQSGFSDVHVVTLEKDASYAPADRYVEMFTLALAAVIPAIRDASPGELRQMIRVFENDLQLIVEEHTVDGALVQRTVNRIVTATA